MAMGESRQQAFLKLKQPCVHLSSVALKYRTKEAPAKDVLKALENVYKVLYELGDADQLDPKLSEYAFFPIAQQVFNEARTLSPRCLEVAADCVAVLVSKGYRHNLSPELGKQLLILMTMLSGAGPNEQRQQPTDDLIVASFKCIAVTVHALASSASRSTIFADQGTKNVVDQLFYLLLEAIAEKPSEHVQLAASQALLALLSAIDNRVFLASLLPRTVSTLTKALKISTTARRTPNVLATNVHIVLVIIEKCLADQVALHPADKAESDTLDASWQKASASQIRNALLHISKLRSHEKIAVRQELQELCLLVIEQCSKTLSESVPVMLETLVSLATQPDGATALKACKHLVAANTETSETLRESLITWSQSIPRILQGHDDRPKVALLHKLSVVLQLLGDHEQGSRIISDILTPLLMSGMSSSAETSTAILTESENIGTAGTESGLMLRDQTSTDFPDVLYARKTQADEAHRILDLLSTIRNTKSFIPTARKAVDAVEFAQGQLKVVALWVAIHMLDPGIVAEDDDIGAYLQFDDEPSFHDDRKSLLADLHATTFQVLNPRDDFSSESTEHSWQLQALAIRATVMYAETFPGDSYRPELSETLYPVLASLASSNLHLRECAMIALNRLSKACQYSSAADLLIDNVDYLVNSIAWKLNIYSLSPEAPQILRMMVHLCGARLVVYLDDLIQSIFAALDTYHGYPQWVELLFGALQAIVRECIKQPQLALEGHKISPEHRKAVEACSNIEDVLFDLRARKRRKLDFPRDANEPPTKAPQRPWTNQLDGPTFGRRMSIDENMHGNEDDDRLQPLKKDDSEDNKLSKPHDLLLQIANAATPHLTSPSPTVRHLLLDLIQNIAPLLSRDENTFLPLINAVWPSVMPRLLSASESETPGDGEVSFNVCAAADTIATLCECAGDFMSTRIESILDPIKSLLQKITKDLNTGRLSGHANAARNQIAAPESSALISGADLQIIEPSKTSSVTKFSDPAKLLKPISHTIRTSKNQVLRALLNLLKTILTHTRVSLDNGDSIVEMLLPFMERDDTIRQALLTYNADIVWWYELKHRTDQTRIQPREQIPVLRPRLHERGIQILGRA